MFRNYLKTALSNLLRNRVYSFINIAGLSLGLACTMLIMLYVKDEVSYDRFHKNSDRIFHLGRKVANPDGEVLGVDGYTGLLQGPRFTEGIPEIQSFVRLRNIQQDIQRGEEILSQEIYLVDTSFFSVFSFPLLSGNPETALRDPRSVVVTERMAISQFGTTDALGKQMLIKVNETFESYTVSAVARNCPENSTIKFSVLCPLVVSKEVEQRDETWLNSFLHTFVVLHEDADSKKVEATMQRVFASVAKSALQLAKEKYNSKWTPYFIMTPITSLHLNKDYAVEDGLSDASNPAFSYILTGIAFFILMIACINFINLTVARSLRRAKEIGVRKVIGGTRKQLMIQFLSESFLLSGVAFLFAILLVQLVLPFFNGLSGKILELSYLLDVQLVSGYVVLFVLTGLLAGFYPALILSKYNPVQALYKRFAMAGKNYLQKSLVVVQFALASFLIIGTLVIFAQFNFLTSQPLGYNDSDLVRVDQWGLTAGKSAVFREQLQRHAGISGVAFKNRDWWNTSVYMNGDVPVVTVSEVIDESFLPLLGVTFLEGRNFSEELLSDADHSVIVNEAFVRSAGWKEPIGQTLKFFGDDQQPLTVIGVVRDYHFQTMSEKVKPQVFTLNRGGEFGTMYVKISPENRIGGLQHIESTFRKLMPLSPYAYTFKDQENLRNYQAEARWKQIMLFGTIITIFISCIGLFGLSVLAAEKRTKEIGIRKVLGASVTNVVAILSVDFLKLVVMALVAAIPVAWFVAADWLQRYPYRIVLNGWTFALAGLLVTGIALTTISFQSIRAALSNPVDSLRSE